MSTRREIRYAECVLRTQLLPGGTIIFNKPVSKALTAAGKKIDTTDVRGNFIGAPAGSKNIFRKKIFFLIAYKTFDKKVWRLVFLKNNVWIKPHNNVREADVQSIRGTIIIKVCTLSNALIRESVIFSKTCDLKCFQIKTCDSRECSYPQLISDNDQACYIVF